ncbi:MAG: sensor histidine kinase [Kiritimatiellia bacterium]|jgi:two-component system, sporulation sensor kinase E
MASGFFDRFIARVDKIDPERLQTHLMRFERERGLLETIFQTIQEGVLVVDAGARLAYANRAAAALLGFDPDRSIDRPVDILLPDFDWERMLEMKADAEWSHLLRREIEVIRPDHRILDFYAVPLPEGNDMPGGLLVILRDITRDREQEASALESERLNAVRLLAASVAHEIGNPLNALDIHLQLLERELDPLPEESREPIRELVKVARDEVGRLDAIITQFLHALRPQKPDLVPADIGEILQQSLRIMKVDIANRRIDVTVRYPDKMPKLFLDPAQIKQVFFNLVKNAVEAMPDGGRLDITMASGDVWFTIDFLDSGSGIAPEGFARMFEPYHTTKVKGNGLGLAVVQRIVQEHGGEIEVSSKAGAGTCFRVRLPVGKPRMRLISDKREKPHATRSAKGNRHG